MDQATSIPTRYYGLGHTVATLRIPPSMWPIVLALANKAGAHTQTAYQIVGAAIGSITVALAGLLGRRVAGPSIGLVAAVIVACCPMLIVADGSIMSDTLYVAFVTAALLAVVLGVGPSERRPASASSACWSAWPLSPAVTASSLRRYSRWRWSGGCVRHQRRDGSCWACACWGCCVRDPIAAGL